MIVLKDEGLYCPEGDFFIDPLLPCKNAVITHAHADHARPGMKNYICTPETSEIMKLRISNDLLIKEVEYNNEIQINSVKITFIPAGHVLGSSQIKIDNGKYTIENLIEKLNINDDLKISLNLNQKISILNYLIISP